jgi:hypothetical protein
MRLVLWQHTQRQSWQLPSRKMRSLLLLLLLLLLLGLLDFGRWMHQPHPQRHQQMLLLLPKH